MTQTPVVSRAALHFWEEPCISGTKGSGTVFFAGCNLQCVFCQNYEIAHANLHDKDNWKSISECVGKIIGTKELATIFLKLQKQGANNINLVTPTHFVPEIVRALEDAKQRGLRLPIVYNTGGYESIETLKMLEGLVDVYLPDMKYASSELAADYSKAPDYPKIAEAALEEMYRQVGSPLFYDAAEADAIGIEENIMKRGMLVRHLVLPGHTKDSCEILQRLYHRYGDQIYISIMNQYTPSRSVRAFPELNRKVTKREYERVVDYALALGISNAFIQEGDTAKESFIPDFGVQAVNEGYV